MRQCLCKDCKGLCKSIMAATWPAWSNDHGFEYAWHIGLSQDCNPARQGPCNPYSSPTLSLATYLAFIRVYFRSLCGLSKMLIPTLRSTGFVLWLCGYRAWDKTARSEHTSFPQPQRTCHRSAQSSTVTQQTWQTRAIIRSTLECALTQGVLQTPFMVFPFLGSFLFKLIWCRFPDTTSF